jgi:hypothetical protein
MRMWWNVVAVACGLLGCTSEVDDTDPDDTVVEESDTLEGPDTDTDTEVVVDTDDTLEEFVPCLERGDAVLELGIGLQTFSPLVEGQDVELEQGGQDPPGYHIWGAIRARNVSQFVTIHYVLTDVGTNVVLGDYNFNVALLPLPANEPWDCVGYYPGMMGAALHWTEVRAAAALAADAPISEVLCGTDLRLDFTLTAEGQERASESVTVKVQPDPDLAPHCDATTR